MLAVEKNVRKGSDYYVLTPGPKAMRLFYTVLQVGRFAYEPGYVLHRTKLDSFLVMLVEEGSCILEQNGRTYRADRGKIVLVDCYAEHRYSSETGYRCLWLHFDGSNAREYYEYLTADGQVLESGNYEQVHYELMKLYEGCRRRSPLPEPIASAVIAQMLGLLASPGRKGEEGEDAAAKATAYIGEHYGEPVSVEMLADLVSLSPYHFSRVFAARTGMPPHQYLIAVRLANARYRLLETSASVRDIAGGCGFSSESSFCSAFRKKYGTTPGTYRAQHRISGEEREMSQSGAEKA